MKENRKMEGEIILTGIHYSSGETVRLHLEDGIIRSVEGTGESGGDRLPIVAPGLVDLQVNGYRGIDFNGPELTAEQVETACRELLLSGVTTFWPTVITGPPERVSRNLRVLAGAVDSGGLATSMIGGIHLEGPFISPEDGPRGAHPREYCRLPDLSLVERWQEESGGRVGLITLAPELEGSPDLIRACRERGILVAIGHTGAGSGVIEMAAGAGATLSTHLGNGCHAVLPRHSNYIWDQLAEDRLQTTMIADGFHLPDSVLRVFLRAKGERAMLVSDCMPYAGLEPGKYDSPAAGNLVLTPEGKLHLEGQEEKLAGSASGLLDGVLHMAGLTDFATAWDMASVRPARFMRPARFIRNPAPGGLEQGAPADLLLLDRVGDRGRIRSVFKGGRFVEPTQYLSI